jgi:ABC-2 type transport system permease protein
MKKFLAVVKREYIQRVRTKFFIVATVLGPAMMILVTVVPALMFTINAGGPTRLAVVDETGKMYDRVAKELSAARDFGDDDSPPNPAQEIPVNSNSKDRIDRAGKLARASFEIEEAPLRGRPLAEVKKALDERVRNKNLDGYVVLPADLLKDGQPEFYARNTADLFTRSNVQSRISLAVRAQRLVEANIDESLVRKMSEPVRLKEFPTGGTGQQSSGESSFYLVFGVGFLIYLSVLMYGQMILGAVIEEKETRIAEILFSSMRSFPLMMGKLIGVSLVALTQLGIWVLAFLAFSVWGVAAAAGRGVTISLPHIPPVVLVYFALFFLLGYFIYSTIYALIGSMVTTAQEGGQLALPVLLLLIAGFYLAFPIIRAPNSSLAFWASMFPFFAPITMLVRIVTEMPPFWQIALSLGIGFATVAGLTWLASRVYRVGMLMYGKKASIPEVWRWVRQS